MDTKRMDSDPDINIKRNTTGISRMSDCHGNRTAVGCLATIF